VSSTADSSARTLLVDDLGKRYFHQAPWRNRTLQERYVGRHQESGPRGEYWSLRHVSFELAAGEALGVVGANGAGKSTLLRLVAGLGRPDEGTIRRHGEISAMLELGAGFHPDLTGRENAVLASMIAGHRRARALERLDEIVAFSGLERFVDDPLRTYSNGMQARLGFAVALAVTPACTVLVIDEVLAVGDAEFAARCLDRISAFRDRGGSLLIVSHAMPLIRQLCDRALWLRDGHVAAIGSPAPVIESYLAEEGAPQAAHR
jgi:lipopolysaccharide transport system ATP-binding protein